MIIVQSQFQILQRQYLIWDTRSVFYLHHRRGRSQKVCYIVCLFACLRFYLIKTWISTLMNGLILLPADLLGTVALLIPGLQDIRGILSSWLPGFLNMVVNGRSFINYTKNSSIGPNPNILFYPLLDTRFKDQGLFLLPNAQS